MFPLRLHHTHIIQHIACITHSTHHSFHITSTSPQQATVAAQGHHALHFSNFFSLISRGATCSATHSSSPVSQPPPHQQHSTHHATQQHACTHTFLHTHHHSFTATHISPSMHSCTLAAFAVMVHVSFQAHTFGTLSTATQHTHHSGRPTPAHCSAHTQSAHTHTQQASHHITQAPFRFSHASTHGHFTLSPMHLHHTTPFITAIGQAIRPHTALQPSQFLSAPFLSISNSPPHGGKPMHWVPFFRFHPATGTGLARNQPGQPFDGTSGLWPHSHNSFTHGGTTGHNGLLAVWIHKAPPQQLGPQLEARPVLVSTARTLLLV